MITLEKNIERRVVDRAMRELGVVSLKLNVHGQTGFPDRLFFVHGGKPLMIEFKRPGGEVSPRQRYVFEQLTLRGYTVQVHDNVESAIEAIRRAVGSP